VSLVYTWMATFVLGGEAENTDEEQMYIKAAGALGVLANESDTNNTNTELRLQSGDTNNSNITMVGKSSAQYMTFGTNAAERMRIDSSGNVGIGTTSPSVALEVFKNGGDMVKIGNSGSYLKFDNGGHHIDVYNTSDASGRLLYLNKYSKEGVEIDDRLGVGGYPTKGGANLYVYGNTYITSNLTVGTDDLHVDTTTGNVGIGTTSPDGRLHISSGTSGDCHLILQSDTDNNNESDNPKIVFRQDGAINTAEIGLGNNMLALRGTSGIAFYDGTASATDIDNIENTSTELMRITDGGYVGIGTTSPEYTLDVVGKSSLGTVVLNPQTYLMSNVNYFEYTSSTITTFNKVLLQIDKSGTANSDHAEYSGYVDCEIVAQRTITNGGPEIFTSRVNFMVAYDDAYNRWQFNTFIQENKSFYGYISFQSTPVFKYKYDGRQLQLYVSFDAKEIRSYTSFTARITSDGDHINDISLPGPDELMGTGTDGTAELGICYGLGHTNKASYVGIGTDDPTSNLHVAGDAYVSSNLTVGTANLHVDTTTGFVGVGTTNPTSNLDVIGAAAISTDLTVGTAGVDSNVTLHANKTYCSAGRTTTYTGLSSSNANEIGYLDMSVISTSNNTFVKVFVKVGQGAASSEMEYSFYIRPNAANWAWIYDYKQIGSVNIVPVVYRTDANDLYEGASEGVVRFGYLASSAQSVSWRVEMYERSGNAKFVPTNTGSAVDGTGLVQVTPAPYMRIDSNVAIGENDLFVDTQTGRVGVGTTNPTSNLHVVGDINLTSNIVMNGEVFVKAHDATNNHVAIGPGAGQTEQNTYTVAIGYQAGQIGQNTQALAVGYLAGQTSQGNNATALGRNAGQTSQGINATAIGSLAGQTSQGTLTVAVGRAAGNNTQGDYAIGVGYRGGFTSQGDYAVAVGPSAGQTSQGTNAVAVGPSAGQTSQGTNAVAVGYLAGQTSQHDNTVVLNASGSALNTEGTGRTYIKPLRVATVASNVMTYDQTTGEVMDSGGLFTNRLAVVSEQPPSALTGATTTIQGHGKYVVEVSSTANSANAKHQAFDKNSTGSAWLSAANYDANGDHTNSAVTLNSIQGDYIKLTLPYKTTLRHFTLACRNSANSTLQFPTDFTLLASNDGSSWTSLYSLSGGDTPSIAQVSTYIVNAASSYKTYAIVVEKISPNSGPSLQGGFSEWRLFTESFSVEGGIVTTTAASGLETGFTEHPVAPLTGSTTYNANIGTNGEFPPSTHYVEGHGTYEVWASSQYNVSGQATREVWKLFDGSTSTNFQEGAATNYEFYNSSSPYEYVGTRGSTTTDVGGTRYKGVWVQLKLPYTITLAYTKINNWTPDTDRSPGAGVILGSNDGDNWYKLTEFTGLTYTSNEEIVQVNATTPYQYYRMVATNTIGSIALSFTEWRLFSATGVTKMDNVLISGELAVDGGALQTSHIKWPKVPLKANESEGYVASVSSVFNSFYNAWNAFEDKGEYTNDVSPAWASGNGSFSGGSAETIRTTGDDTFAHEWLQIQLPQAIQLSYFNIVRRDIYSGRLTEAPKNGFMYGSNDGVTWTKLVAYSDLTYMDYQPTRVNVQSTTPYIYYRLAVTATIGSQNYVAINELQLFESTLGVGTSATTAKLTVDGGLGLAKGSQVFAGSDVITEFPKHDRPLVKYPEATSGTVVTNSTDTQPGTAFNLNYSDIGWHPTANYTSDTGVADGSTTTIDMKGIEYDGEWTQVLLPVAVKVKYLDVYYRYSSKRQTRDGTVLGSNDGTNWTHLQSWDDLSLTESTSIPHHLEVNSTKYFNYIRYIVERVAGETLPNIREIEIWGTEEGDESVDVVHRSIPNKPSQQQLAVYYEARDPNSYSFADSSNVYDLSGSGVTGTIYGAKGFNAKYNSWILNNDNVDYIAVSEFPHGTGAWAHSVSTWMYRYPTTSTTSQHVFRFGASTTSTGCAARFEWISNQWMIRYYFFGNDVIFYLPEIGKSYGNWLHITATYDGRSDSGVVNGSYGLARKLYINGVPCEVQSSASPGSLALGTTSSIFYLGHRAGSGSLIGEVANGRVYSKALNADQVQELYEYDAERFGHRQNLVALHKGNLGVGVTNPTSRFEVAGADGLQEFPPKAMTGHETYIEGHGVFRVSASSFLDASEISGWTQDFPTWYAFNKSNTQGWISNQTKYSNSNGIAGTSSDNRFGIRGEWLEIEMPSKIKLKHFTLSLASDGGDYSDAYNTSRFPQVFNLYKSNDGITWTPATEITTPTAPVLASYGSTQQYVIDENEYYNRYLIQVKQTFADGTYTGGQSTHTAIGEWRLFGTPAPSSLEDGHLTLGKALTLPRVSGHPAGAETPRAESLVVHYDTTVDSVVSGSTVVDISGEGNNGTLVNGAAYSSTDRALTFDGGNDYVTGNLTGISGNFIFSASLWVYHTSTTENQPQFFTIGSNAVNQMIGFRLNGSMTEIRLYFYSRDTLVATISTILNTWNHFVVTYDGSTQSVYQNGVLVKSQAGSGLNLPQNPELRIGYRSGGASTEYLNGYLSNFKLWNVALMAKEIAQEYALGRTGKSINLTDTALCLGGTVPRAQLDVRGSAYINGIVGTGPTGGLIIPSGTSAQQPTGVTGMLRFNTTLGRLQVHDGTFWKSINRMSASGGTVTYVGGYTVHTFKTGGSFTVASGGDIDVLMVGGGGGGGADNAGGGGAGGLIFRPRLLVDAGSYTIDIGTGGTGAPAQGTTAGKGGDTEAFGLTAVGGGYGNNGNSDGTQNSGGSGGGGDGERGTAGGTGTQPSQSGDSGTYGYGNDGGDGYPSNNNAGGGGGGAGVAGVDGGVNDGGAGGDGLNEVTVNGFVYNFADIFGTASGEIISGEAWFAGGGAGGNKNEVTTSISGGNGGGGGTANYYTDSGTANTGGGGGGSTYTGSITPAGGNGGSGIVIIRYLS
jgi:hypothetical protein